MKRQIKREWIKALKSGEYKQGKHALVDKTGRKYCCLGVLGCVSGLDNKALRSMVDINGDKNNYLTEDFAKSVGLTYEGMETLAGMNDDDNQTFEYIAKYISHSI